jgi:outer membrane protein assembly factor BamB/type 1 glutamine amidotransferase
MSVLRGLGVLMLLAAAGMAAAAPREVVLIGGTTGEGPAQHAYRAGLEKLAAQLQTSAGERLVVRRHLDGWPADPKALQNAATLVLYFEGDTRHPLLDAGRRQDFEALMKRGVGVVALHQASTLPVGGPDLVGWLGAQRDGLFDRSTATVTLQPADHAVAQGLAAFTLRDEFYPTLRFAAQGVAPVLTAELHAQFRDGQPVVDEWPAPSHVAWAFERSGGGRSFGYTGVHYLSAFDQPMVARLLVNAVRWTAGLAPAPGERPRAVAPQASAADVSGFHGGAARSGWHRDETRLTPAAVAGPGFGALWQSPALHADGDAPARLYATPLYVDRLTLTRGAQQGQTFSAVIAATSNGDVYAINAAKAGDVAPGRILWRTKLAPACRLQPAPLDGVATGILSTPVLDVARGRLYVTHCDPRQRWQAYALDLASGAVLPGWPVRLDEPALNAVNRNAGPEPVAPKRKFDFRVQRGALNLSPDGSRLYVAFGESETGWLASVDTHNARLASAFAAVAMPHRGSGGIWGSGGPAVDQDGFVYVVTGSGFDGYKDQPHDWTQSVLKLADGPHGLTLVGTYTPFNHCRSAKMDIDLGAGGAALLPGSPLMVVGGKQGNAYLLDRARLPGKLNRRPPCSDDAAGDGSLLPPEPQPQFGTRGPLSVFGPYSEDDAALDLARARSVPAAMRDAAGQLHVFMTGNTRVAPGSAEAQPPSLARLVVAGETTAPHLRIERRQMDIAFGNPGSPVVSGSGPGAVVWVLDENARRSALLTGANAPAPVLYAFDADTLTRLWQSAPGELRTSGKYNEPLIVRGQVIVGTDRLQAFGLGATPRAAARPAAPAAVLSSNPATTWQQRCAACHDAPQGNIPPRALVASRPAARIVDALTHGVMQAQATGLAAADIAALARWLNTSPTPTP